MVYDEIPGLTADGAFRRVSLASGDLPEWVVDLIAKSEINPRFDELDEQDGEPLEAPSKAP